MAALLEKTAPKNLGQLLKKLGNIPPERILLQPSPGTATEEDAVALLEAANKRLVELVDGVLVEKPMGWKESVIALLVGHYLWDYLEKQNRGIALTADGPVRLKPGRIRIPDVCFVSWERMPEVELAEGAILDAIPDLAVEVISRGNTRQEMALKLRDYFKAGVRLVWFLYPKSQIAVVYTSRTDKKEIDSNGKLEGGKVLPGFSLPLRKLFARTQRPGSGK